MFQSKFELTIMAEKKQDLDITKNHFITLLKIMQKSEYPSTMNWKECTTIEDEKNVNKRKT